MLITEEPVADWRRIWRGCLPMWQQQRALRRERLRLRRKRREQRLVRRWRETEAARKHWYDAWCDHDAWCDEVVKVMRDLSRAARSGLPQPARGGLPQPARGGLPQPATPTYSHP